MTRTISSVKDKVISSDIPLYPVLGSAENVGTLLPWLACSTKHHRNFSGKHPATLLLMREGCLYKYPPLYIQFIQLSELQQYRVKIPAQSVTL